MESRAIIEYLVTLLEETMPAMKFSIEQNIQTHILDFEKQTIEKFLNENDTMKSDRFISTLDDAKTKITRHAIFQIQ